MHIPTNLTPPFYAVIFTSLRPEHSEAYDTMADRMDSLVRSEPGFLAMESVHDNEGYGITVCYWKSMDDIKRWKTNLAHTEAQRNGKEEWYSQYAVRIAEITESYEWQR